MDKKIIHSVFESVAERFPEKTAIEEHKHTITYKTLNSQANQLAQTLRERGFQHGDVSALFLPPSIDYIIAMLGILKAGGIFVPLHLDYPNPRLKAVLSKIKSRFLLTSQSLSTSLIPRLTQLNLPIPLKNIGTINTHNVKNKNRYNISWENSKNNSINSNASYNNLSDFRDHNAPCYIITTSGSTGEPKAILGRHKSLSHFIHWQMKEFQTNTSTRVSWLAPPTFDVSLRDIFLPLLSGGTLCIPPEDTRTNPTALLKWMEQSHITLTHIVPSMSRLLMAELEKDATPMNRLPELQHLMSAGEPLYGRDIKRLYNLLGQRIEIINLYGPSETTLAKLFHRISKAPAANAIVPLGKPISNTAAFIIKNNRLCLPGEEGEIYIKTPFLSLGYIDAPDLMERYFVQNPLVDTADVVYRTGDLARYSEDHTIEFIGRKDRQLKINGNRIEPGDIEQVLRDHEEIIQTVIDPIIRPTSEPTLACYYTATREIAGSEIKHYIGQTLPSYMLPSFYAQLEKFPLNINGKVDRSALPKPNEIQHSDKIYEKPTTELEIKLAAIWAQVLGLEKVGVNNGYFEIGGNSLSAMKIVSCVYHQLGFNIVLRDFFANDTVKKLAQWLIDNATSHNKTIPILDKAEHYALSHAQKRLWTLDRLDNNAIYNMPGFFWLKGKLNRKAFDDTMATLVNRHETLRTNFIAINEEPRQVIRNSNSFKVIYRDLRSTTHCETQAHNHAEELANYHFNLNNELMIRTVLMQFSEQLHLFSLNIHHIAGDAWSLNLLAREFTTLYGAFDAGQDSPLAPLPLQYKDFAAWQNNLLNQSPAEADSTYWMEKLKGKLPVLELPLDYPRPAVQTFNGTTLHLKLAEISTSLTTVARDNDVTPFMVLMTGLKALLHRYTNTEDIIVGTTIANREHPDLHNQVGFYVNTLALRDSVSSSDTFYDLLTRIKSTVLESQQHQSYPFDRLVDELNLDRDISRSPLFNVGLVLHEEQDELSSCKNLDITPFTHKTEFSKFEMLFTFKLSDGILSLQLNYNTDLFAAQSAALMAEHLQRLLSQMLTNPEQPLGNIDFYSANEITHLTTASNGNESKTIASVFEQQVLTTPNNLATYDTELQLSYTELNHMANQLAHHLIQSHKLKPAQVVGVFAERCTHAIVAALAICKAGGIYMPLDVKLPNARIDKLLQDSQCHLVLSHGNCLKQIKQLDIPSINITARLNETNKNPDLNIDHTSSAYLIYTSGSTGRPKGVMVTHGGFTNMSLHQAREFDVQACDRVLQFASLGFDASLSEIFMALFSGAALVFVNNETIADPEEFLHFVHRERINIATLPPVYLATLDGRALPFKTLITAGEAARANDVSRYADTLNYFNAYGPTEFSVCATMQQVNSQEMEPIAIGYPIPGCEIYLLDKNLKTVPQGVSGEICMAGVGLARGYHNMPDATAEKFVNHPTRKGERLYRSGDLGRINHCGKLIFLGRIDHQTKINGRRIEPEEIAYSLALHEEIDTAHVEVRETSIDERELLAWYTEPRRIELWPSIAEFYIYDDLLYNAMATDHERNRVYLAAFEKWLPDKIVVEPGPGPQCILSRMCIKAGAKKVYAVELLEETYHKARKTVADLGLQDRIILIHANIMDVELPEKADYCISEIVGGIGGSEGAAVLLENTRRLLKNPANMIPSRTLTKMAAAELTPDDLPFSFPKIASHYVDQIFEQVGYAFDLRLCLKHYPKEKLLSDADVFEDLDYTQPMAFEDSHKIRLNFNRVGKFTGFLVWLCLYSDDDNLFDVLDNQKSWLPLYLSVSIKGYDVTPGDVFVATVERLLCNDLNPDFHINGELIRANDENITIKHNSYHYKNEFKQAPIYDLLFDGSKPNITPSPSTQILRNHLRDQLPEYMIPKHFIGLDRFPVTPNGKIDRAALPLPTVEKETNNYIAARNDVETALISCFEAVLKRKVGISDNYFAMGGDSIKAIQVASGLRNKGYTFPVMEIFKYPTVAELAAQVNKLEEVYDDGPVTGSYPLTAIQTWFFETFTEHTQHFNQSVLLRSAQKINNTAMNSAIQEIWHKHDVLRSRFQRQNNVMIASIDDVEKTPALEVIDLTGDSNFATALEKNATRLQRSINLQKGPLIKIAIFQTDDGDRLLLIIHHLVIDGVSWRILAQDIEQAYMAANAGAKPLLPPRTASFTQWAKQVHSYAESDQLIKQQAYWSTLAKYNLVPLPSDIESSTTATVAQRNTQTFVLKSNLAKQLLTEAHDAYRTQINDLLLTAVAQTIRDWSGADEIAVTLEGHGREPLLQEMDISRTIGWFTSAYPIILQLPNTTEISESIKSIKRCLHSIPEKGVGYGILRYLSKQNSHTNFELKPEILFNYLGSFDSEDSNNMFNTAPESRGQQQDLRMPLTHALDISGKLESQGLVFTFAFDNSRFTLKTINALGQSYLKHLQELIKHCTTLKEHELTPEDIDLEGFSQEQLDDVFAMLED